MFGRLNLHTKLVFGFTLIALIAGAIGLTGISGIHHLSQQILNVQQCNHFSNLADDSLDSILQHRRHEKDFFLNLSDPPRKAKALALFGASAADLERKLGMLKMQAEKIPELSSDEREVIARLPEKHRAYLEGFHTVVALIEANPGMTSQEADQHMLPYKKDIYELESAILKIKLKGDELADGLIDRNVWAAANVRYLLYGAVVFGFLIAVFLGLFVASRITRPLIQLTTAADKLRQGDCEIEIRHTSGDELGALAESFRQMHEAQRRKVKMAEAIAAGDLDAPLELASEKDALGKSLQMMTMSMKSYIKNLMEITVAKERIQSELKLATDIQASLLPRIFPPFPDRREFDIFAFMEPAKEVGGDFYDFFFVNERTLCFLIADVSDKGVPAALYMMVAKTLLKTEALRGLPPDEVLFRVNNLLTLDNDSCMFVTVFCAILDTETGEVRFANAGHNPPLIYNMEHGFNYLKINPGFVLGPMPDTSFVTEKLFLEENDILFLYTDGVTEARNQLEELYGEKRLLEALTGKEVSDMSELVHFIREDLENHACGAPQSDDVTMLAIKFKGGTAKSSFPN